MDADLARVQSEVRRVPSVMEFVGDAEKIGEALAPMAADTHDLTKLPKAAGPLMKWIDEKWFRFRMRPLLGVLNFYEDSSVREMANVTKRLFGRELSSGDVERARRYAAAVTKYAPKLGMAD